MGGMSSGYSGSYDWRKDDSVTKRSASSYADDDDRNYKGFSSVGIDPPVGKNIKTESKLAAVLVVDVTGSMREWPKLIFEKLPTLYNEANVALQGIDPKELGEDSDIEQKLELSIIAIGDAKGDSRPLQVVDFCKGSDLVDKVNELYPEGGGGGNIVESYDLAAYFLANHCETPNCAKPICIIAGDEGFYDKVSKRYVRDLIGDKLETDLDTIVVLNELKEKFDVYILRPEPMYDAGTYKGIQKQWEDAIGAQRVLRMEDPRRLVDCIIAVSSYAADNINCGKALLKRRQTPEQVKQVLATLHPLLEGGKPE